MAEFRGLLVSHLARTIETLISRTMNRGTWYRSRVAHIAVTLCWRDREMFQPPEESWLNWFDDHAVEARGWVWTGLHLFPDERELWKFLLRDESPRPARLFTSSRGRYDRALAAQKVLPVETVSGKYVDPEIREAIENTERRRREIRAGMWERLIRGRR